MEIYDRSGRNLSSLKLGRVKCLRQEILHPGERLDSRVSGRVRLAALREQESLPVHVHLEAFLTPLRWLDDDWTDYLTEGPGTSTSLNTSVWTQTDFNCVGVGANAGDTQIWDVWRNNYDRVYNEYFKWPEDADSAIATANSDAHKFGLLAVNLPSWWTRFNAGDGVSDSERELVTSASGSREKFDIRDLSELMARFRHETTQDWLSSGRYREFLQAAWDAAGVREVDEVPLTLGYSAGVMSAQNLWATDSDGLGAIAGVYEFDVDHSFGRVSSPEHSILSYFIVVRALPVIEGQSHPHLTMDDRGWAEITGHPQLLASQRPRRWNWDNVLNERGTAHVLGYAPAGQEWRVGWDVVDDVISDRNSFLTMREALGFDSWKYHPANMDSAFRSTSLGHALCHLFFNQRSHSLIPAPFSSIMTGA